MICYSLMLFFAKIIIVQCNYYNLLGSYMFFLLKYKALKLLLLRYARLVHYFQL